MKDLGDVVYEVSTLMMQKYAEIVLKELRDLVGHKQTHLFTMHCWDLHRCTMVFYLEECTYFHALCSVSCWSKGLHFTCKSSIKATTCIWVGALLCTIVAHVK